MMELVGMIGSLAFAVVSLPIVIESIRTKSSRNISVGYLALSLIGNICCFSYVIYMSVLTGYVLVPLYLNYSSALLITILLVVLKWKIGK